MRSIGPFSMRTIRRGPLSESKTWCAVLISRFPASRRCPDRANQRPGTEPGDGGSTHEARLRRNTTIVESASKPRRSRLNRRELLRMIGTTAGSAAMYQAMTSMGLAHASPSNGPINLQGAPKDSSVLVLGAGIAGMTAAYELRNAGYRVQVLEYNGRAGGRNWTLRGGDRYTELGGDTQECRFDPGHYINPGPWRLPYHHRGMLSYCKRLGVALEPFVQINYNAYVHSRKAFGGKPQRLRAVKADYHGHVAELLAKATQDHALDADVTPEDRATLLDSLRFWGALDKKLRYAKSAESSDRR